MNPKEAPSSPFVSSRFLQWLKRPRLLASHMPTEIIPQGLVSIELKVAGWGWTRLEVSGEPKPRKWFWKDQGITLFAPVGSHPILTLGNLWGTRRYQVDATAGREEVWVPPSTRFLFRLPDSASTNLPKSPLGIPSDCWRAAGVNASGSGHWRMHLPTDRTVMLPKPPPALAPPDFKLDKWHPKLSMDDLDRRLTRAANTD
jgi:hypothetical protein